MQSAIKYSLDGSWDLSFTAPCGEKYDTSVKIPCNIEPVLKELGLVEDYLPSDNDEATLDFEGVDDWCYRKVFDFESKNKAFSKNLVFEGIDTIAEVYLNGEKILDCIDMHMTYKADVTNLLKEKANELVVIVRSSQLWARKQPRDMFTGVMVRPNYHEAAVNLRKARHQWGWDNAPRLVTSGIYRSVYIEEVPPCRFEEVYLHTVKIDENEVHLGAGWIFATEDKSLVNYKINLTLSDGDEIIYEETNPARFIQGLFKYRIPRDKVKLWWPTGYGEPYMYTVKLKLTKNGETLASYEAPFGIRTLYLDKTDDILSDGTGEFVFKINGEKVFIRGTNWKPLSPLGSEADIKTKEGKALEMRKDLNCNMVRIWGGGIYEDEFFFDWCDKNGIMIWQDFMFACEIPSNNEDYCRLAAEEVKQIIIKYRNHPALAIWCGDNENDECLMWLNQYSQNLPSQSVISRKILKQAVLNHDPFRCYIESSPYASDENYRQRFEGEMTNFQPESHFYPNVFTAFERLRELNSRFIGETGPITICAIAANDEILKKETPRAKRLWNSPKLPSTKLHQDDGYFTAWRKMGQAMCLEKFGRDFSFEEFSDYRVAVNVFCSEIFKEIIEYSRALYPEKTGVIWWSLADMWQMLFNYSVIDSDLKPKMPYFWIRQSQQDFALMLVKLRKGENAKLYASNCTLKDINAKYTITAYDADLNSREVMSGEIAQAKNSSSSITELEYKNPKLLIIKWTVGNKTYVNHAFTGNASLETTKKWIEIIEKECGFKTLEL